MNTSFYSTIFVLPCFHLTVHYSCRQNVQRVMYDHQLMSISTQRSISAFIQIGSSYMIVLSPPEIQGLWWTVLLSNTCILQTIIGINTHIFIQCFYRIAYGYYCLIADYVSQYCTVLSKSFVIFACGMIEINMTKSTKSSDLSVTYDTYVQIDLLTYNMPAGQLNTQTYMTANVCIIF